MEQQVQLITDISYNELIVYLDLINNLKPQSYEEILSILKSKFNVIITLDRLKLIYEPTLEEEILDLKLQYSNLGLL